VACAALPDRLASSAGTITGGYALPAWTALRRIHMANRKWLLLAFAAASASCAGGNEQQQVVTGEDDGEIGSVSLDLTTVPSDVGCVKVSVTGTRPLVQLIDVTPNASISYTIARLPLGIITLSGEAYTGACNAVSGTSVSAYVTDSPVSVRVDAVDVNTVTLNFIRNGRVGVSANFEDTSSVPYIVPVDPTITTKPLLTTGDSVNNKPDGTPYRMVGIPDGLGAFDNGDGTFTLLMNHELTTGTTRSHGATGAFVSKWLFRKSDLTALNGADLIQNVARFDAATASYQTPAKGVQFQRFCSADLAPKSAWYDAASGLGYDGLLYLNGEETTGGKAWAHALNGISYELPRLGKQAFENLLANPTTGAKTVVIGNDDTTPGQVYVYVGTKTGTGSPVQQAGLTNGALYGVSITGFAAEPSATGIPSGTAFTLASLGNVETQTGAQIETASDAAGVTKFLRPEDGAWDPNHPNDYYFVTTNAFNAPSRLWRLHFTDINNPTAGGTIDMLLDGSEGQQMFDNIAVDKKGHVYLLEDVGNNAWLGQVWRYTIATDTLTLIAKANPDLFVPGAPKFLTQDEEASGIIDASDILGGGWFLVDLQAHKVSTDAELVEGGQLLAIFDPAAK